jgi:hypothetical protein
VPTFGNDFSLDLGSVSVGGSHGDEDEMLRDAVQCLSITLSDNVDPRAEVKVPQLLHCPTASTVSKASS